MTNNIIIREVNFMGDTLMAAQDENQQIWVGAGWICNGIGFNKHQKDRQILNVQEDLVLRQGCLKFEAGVFDPNNVTVAIMLDFLPLWLAKISITPAMKRESPGLVEKLVAYQLKAKDILAAAFLPQYVQPKVEPQPNMTSMLNQFYCCFESSMRSELKVRFNEAIPAIIQMLSSSNIPTSLPTPTVEIREVIKEVPYSAPLSILMKCPDGQEWKQWVYYMIDTYIIVSQSKQTRKDVLSDIYHYLCKNYGMVSDQLAKEYRRNYHHQGRASTITIIEANKSWRSIFDCVLCDKVNNAVAPMQSTIQSGIEALPAQIQIRENTVEPICDNLIDMISKLISLRNDTTIHGGTTYRAIYKRMYTPKEWKYKIAGYKRKMGVSTAPRRISVIMSNAKLKKECTDVVSQMLVEIVQSTAFDKE